MKTITLCADDYAFDAAASRGIVELAEMGRLSAVSCMSVSTHWPEHAYWLASVRDRIDIGLHVTLTELAPLGSMPTLAPQGKFPGLGKILTAGVLHRLPLGEIARELQRQMAAFIDQFGRAPDFIDGHQHVHLLPGVREAVLQMWAQYLKPHGGYLRSCHEPLHALLRRGVEPWKAFVIAQLSRGFTRMARTQGATINESFRGVHDFSGRCPPAELFPAFFRGGGEPALVMCHPGKAGDNEEDLLHDWRPQEFAYFASEQFSLDLETAGVSLGRLPRR